ncbi:MAG: hypothetical protein MUC50_23100, partial [Myxococcota bacterium]|nr:hypothetical protein [Myxococcota bacterium]
LQEKELSDPGAAIESYRDVLSQHPTNAVAIEALERIAQEETYRGMAIEVLEPLHRDAERWDRLAAVLELKLAILSEPAQRQDELIAIAELHEGGRSNLVDAFDAYDRALAEDASNMAVVDHLERLARSERLFDRLAESLSRRVENVYEPGVEIELLSRLGHIREVELHDAQGAIAALQRALDAGADDPSLLLSVDRLYEREGMWSSKRTSTSPTWWTC